MKLHKILLGMILAALPGLACAETVWEQLTTAGAADPNLNTKIAELHAQAIKNALRKAGEAASSGMLDALRALSPERSLAEPAGATPRTTDGTTA